MNKEIVKRLIKRCGRTRIIYMRLLYDVTCLSRQHILLVYFEYIMFDMDNNMERIGSDCSYNNMKKHYDATCLSRKHILLVYFEDIMFDMDNIETKNKNQVSSSGCSINNLELLLKQQDAIKLKLKQNYKKRIMTCLYILMPKTEISIKHDTNQTYTLNIYDSDPLSTMYIKPTCELTWNIIWINGKIEELC